jgi:protocadherin Fat 1/2/3
MFFLFLFRSIFEIEIVPTLSTMEPPNTPIVSYRKNTAETYIRHPNSYLPKYNIQSETDGESIPLTQSNDAMVGGGSNRMGQQRMLMKNGVDIGPHQIVQSDEDDVPAYGFPSQKRRNRIEQSDFEYNKRGKFIAP